MAQGGMPMPEDKSGIVEYMGQKAFVGDVTSIPKGYENKVKVTRNAKQ